MVQSYKFNLNNGTISLKFNVKFWLKFSIFNLLLVGLLGLLMRYKIAFEFPYFNQKYLQEAHSHFAFAGWIAHTLFTLVINYIQYRLPSENLKKYNLILGLNLVCAYGMIVFFAIQGYGSVSLVFSTGSIIIACFFTWLLLKDFKKISTDNTGVPWFKAAIWFNIISSVGTFYLAYMMVTRNFNEQLYLASVYFYLHFQYNGFFILTCMGLAYSYIHIILPTFKKSKLVFSLFFLSVIPAYFLSTLWANIPKWLYIIAVISAFIQVIAWIRFLLDIKSSFSSKTNLSKLMGLLLLFVGLAFSVKLLLQLGSTIPQLSKLAFGFRPIVIAYLHLILLAVISVFLLTFIHTFKLINQNNLTLTGLVLFVIGVFLNEFVLAVQGIASFSYIPIPWVNETLFAIALILSVSLFLLSFSLRR